MANQTRRRWTPEKKAVILKDAEAVGVAAAAKKNKVTESSIYSWRSRAAAKAAPAAPRTRKRRRSRSRTTDVTANVKDAHTRKVESENAQLRGLVIDQLLEIKRLQK